ncbi:MAG TPA: Asp23/Gls24 family envelope stress response protein [Actinomycetes bacterium]|nr:Asp23/Gls24 family envelope stress response protein [Actinomycetes bacterium]
MVEVGVPRPPGAGVDEPTVPLGGAVAEPPTAGRARRVVGARGTTRVSRRVLTIVIAQAAREVPGVHWVGRPPAGAVGTLLGRHPAAAAPPSGGLEVAVEGGRVAAGVELAVLYGTSIAAVAQAVRRRAAERLRTLLGLELGELDVTVAELVADQPPPVALPRVR